MAERPSEPVTAVEAIRLWESGAVKLTPAEDPHGVVYDGGVCTYKASNGWSVDVFIDVDQIEEIHAIRDGAGESVIDRPFRYEPSEEVSLRVFAFAKGKGEGPLTPKELDHVKDLGGNDGIG